MYDLFSFEKNWNRIRTVEAQSVSDFFLFFLQNVWFLFVLNLQPVDFWRISQINPLEIMFKKCHYILFVKFCFNFFSRCHVFRSMFENDLDGEEPYVLSEISPEIFSIMLQYIYTNSCKIDSENVSNFNISTDQPVKFSRHINIYSILSIVLK